MATSKDYSEAIYEGIEEFDSLQIPGPFDLSLTQVGTLRMFAEIGGTRCWVYATPKYEGAGGIALNIDTEKSAGESDEGPVVDVKDVLEMPHMEQIMRLSEERGGELNPSEKHDLAYLWLERVGPKAEALRELLSA